MVNTKKQQVMNFLLTALTLVLMNSCSKNSLWKDDELSIQRAPYAGNQLRTDGYYYQLVNGELFSLYFLYNNGIISYAGGALNSFQKADEYIEKELINNKNHQLYKDGWGVFVISGDKIEFERWYSSNSSLKSFVRSGVIINDTTFHITSSRRSNGTEQREKDEYYYFRKFSPKPDSTNSFVK